jgi:hypothetical protein
VLAAVVRNGVVSRGAVLAVGVGGVGTEVSATASRSAAADSYTAAWPQ